VRKILKTIVGFVLVAVGLVLSVPGIPGPGLVIAFIGLVMLADHFDWAKRIVEWAKEKFERFRTKLPGQERSKPD
jgi:uncharacterized protein (TIGR02611 family)